MERQQLILIVPERLYHIYYTNILDIITIWYQNIIFNVREDHNII